MARGAKAQQTMGKVGVIQHKAIDKSIGKKEREAIQLEPKSGLKGRAGQQYRGNARPSSTPSRDGRRAGAKVGESSRNGSAKGAREVSKPRPGPSREETPEKKIKKSATATTGYTGTARPRPGASSAKSSSRGEQRGKASRDGGLLAPPGARRRDRYEEEEDEDMDDFIEYDDEDDEPGPRGRGYGYDSDGSSDMEAGLSDIDGEEARAERAARDEDRREQQLEEKLKREKEERRRRWAQSGR
ncbi:hypothetical protein GGR56DRAFT_614849 [Xylariaceae sp. FL0804]|nr:hypothetical protein GGR56DRAFT_614849 [Xylariaceae sp. FL0804]